MGTRRNDTPRNRKHQTVVGSGDWYKDMAERRATGRKIFREWLLETYGEETLKRLYNSVEQKQPEEVGYAGQYVQRTLF